MGMHKLAIPWYITRSCTVHGDMWVEWFLENWEPVFAGQGTFASGRQDVEFDRPMRQQNATTAHVDKAGKKF
jgi:hypothetical protein